MDTNRFAGSRRAGLIALAWFGASLIAAIAAAQVNDPKPPQVSVDFFYPPSPIVQHGTPRLVYEMRITNYVPASYVLESVEVKAGQKTFSFSGDWLRAMLRFFGQKAPVALDRRFDGGQGAVVYFMLDFDNAAAVPRELDHTLHFTASDGSRHTLAVEPLTVSHQPAVVVAAPLRGADWIAGDSVHNGPDAAHRRTILLEGGQPFLAQRYAIDWVRYRMIKGLAATWSGPEDRNSSYFCYDSPIHSVAGGKVVEVLDGVAENVPHSGKYAVDINFINAGGNHAVVDIGGGRYAFYAHMRPGSLKVKLGDSIMTGQVIGRVGNTGSSTEPHLHMHIVDRPSFLGGNGVPYEFAALRASAATDLVTGPNDAWFFKNIGALTSSANDYPADNAAVSFPEP